MTRAKITGARNAKHGEKMIEVRIRFWTDGIAKGKLIVPKHALTSGAVHIQRNKAHGIVPTKPILFNSLLDLGTAIEKTLKKHNIKLHIGRGMKGYLSEHPERS
jgi:hypothetical protein